MIRRCVLISIGAYGDNEGKNFQDAFILDAVNGGIFVWVGKGCTLEERAKAMTWGAKYLKEKVSFE